MLALIAFICGVFLLQVILGESFYGPYMVVPHDVADAWASLRAGHITRESAASFLTLLTYAFLHGGPDHLLGNMAFLWIFAALAAELLGHRWMLAVFACTAVCGGICHVALSHGETIPMLGASGAVTGFEGLYVGMSARWHLPDPHVWPMSRPISPGQLALLGLLGLALDFMGVIGAPDGVAHGAHLGGFIGGMVMGCLVVPKPRLAKPR